MLSSCRWGWPEELSSARRWNDPVCWILLAAAAAVGVGIPSVWAWIPDAAIWGRGRWPPLRPVGSLSPPHSTSVLLDSDTPPPNLLCRKSTITVKDPFSFLSETTGASLRIVGILQGFLLSLPDLWYYYYYPKLLLLFIIIVKDSGIPGLLHPSWGSLEIVAIPFRFLASMMSPNTFKVSLAMNVWSLRSSMDSCISRRAALWRPDLPGVSSAGFPASCRLTTSVSMLLIRISSCGSRLCRNRVTSALRLASSSFICSRRMFCRLAAPALQPESLSHR